MSGLVIQTINNNINTHVLADNKHLKCELSGIVLASLQTDITLEDSLLEGLFFGKRTLNMENKVSDSQVAKQISKKNIRIWNYIVTGNSGYSFYDLKGNIDVNKLNELEQKYNKNIVGWFTTRPQGDGSNNNNNIMQPSLREFTVQNNLSKYIIEKKEETNNTNGSNHLNSYVPSIFAMFQSYMETGSNTPMHHFKYKFHHSLPQTQIQPILIKIITSEINTKEEYTKYTTSSTLSSCSTELYEQMETHFNVKNNSKTETEIIIERLLNDLNVMCNDNINENDEKELFQLLDEIQHIKNGPIEETF